MGDVAMLPHALRALMSAYPGLRVTVATRPVFKPFFEGLGVDFLDVDLKGVHHSLRGMWRLAAEARRLGVEPPVGNLLSSDVFYNKAGNTMDWGKMGVLAIEMETAALYCNAAEAGKRALAMCTISDSLVTGEELPPADRQTTFTQMMEIALGVAVEMAKK